MKLGDGVGRKNPSPQSCWNSGGSTVRKLRELHGERVYGKASWVIRPRAPMAHVGFPVTKVEVSAHAAELLSSPVFDVDKAARTVACAACTESTHREHRGAVH